MTALDRRFVRSETEVRDSIIEAREGASNETSEERPDPDPDPLDSDDREDASIPGVAAAASPLGAGGMMLLAAWLVCRTMFIVV